MPLPEPPVGLQAQADADLAAVRDAVLPLQGPYDAGNRRYWQGLATPATIPADGAVVAPDATRKVPDHASWSSFGASLPATVRCRVSVDAYDGPAGRGWAVRGELIIAGRTFHRTLHVSGPETWRDMADWAEIKKLA